MMTVTVAIGAAVERPAFPLPIPSCRPLSATIGGEAMGLTFRPEFIGEVQRRCRCLANTIEPSLLSAAIYASERTAPQRFNETIARFRTELDALERDWNAAVAAQDAGKVATTRQTVSHSRLSDDAA
jgi:hypothetical protein